MKLREVLVGVALAAAIAAAIAIGYALVPHQPSDYQTCLIAQLWHWILICKAAG